jgi:hypothetical protein
MARERMRRRMAALVRQWDASGETRDVFARRHGLTVSRLDYWKRQMRQASARDAAVGFAPVRVVGDLDTRASAGVEVVLASGLLAQAEAADAAHDAEYGADQLPAELQRRDSRLARIREAKRALDARAKAEAAAAGKPTESAKPDPNAQYNFTDPESRIMKGPDRFVQAYNVQVAVNELQLIVGQAVTQATHDRHQLMPMITTVARQSGETPTQVLADAGYCSEENLAAIATTGIDAYISTRKQKHGERPGPCPRGPLPTTATRVERMTRKLLTKPGAAVYARRKTIVEPVLGQIKQARGFRQFLLRGFAKVQGEWALVCATHNILKLYRLCL